MKLFENYIVQSKSFPKLNGKRVIKTVRWCYCGNKDSTLYEVILDDGKHYELYEDEMTVDTNGGPQNV